MLKRAIIILCLILITGCTTKNNEVKRNDSSLDIVDSKNDEDEVEKDIHLELAYHYLSNVNASQMEMCLFAGDLTEVLVEYNDILTITYNTFKEAFSLATDDSIANIFAYPISNDKYINLTYVIQTYPGTISFGNINSITYDIENDHIITIDEALELENISEVDIIEAIQKTIEGDTSEDQLFSLGFVMDQEGNITFITTYYHDQWGKFYSYNHGKVQCLESTPFELSELDANLVDSLFASISDLGDIRMYMLNFIDSSDPTDTNNGDEYIPYTPTWLELNKDYALNYSYDINQIEEPFASLYFEERMETEMFGENGVIGVIMLGEKEYESYFIPDTPTKIYMYDSYGDAYVSIGGYIN